MKRATVVIAIIFICLLGSSCLSTSGRVKGTVAGVEVSVESLKRMKEFKPPGSGVGYGQPRSLQAAHGNELVLIELKAPNEIKFGDEGIKAKIKDDKGQSYGSIYSQVFGFQDKHAEASILFEVPEHAILPTLVLDETSFDLSKSRTRSSQVLLLPGRYIENEAMR